MAAFTAFKRGLQIAGRIDQKYNINKIFIQKYFPPGYRKTANKIVDIAGSLGGGYGIVRFVESLYAKPPSLSNGFQKTDVYAPSKSYKTRSRQSVRNRDRFCSKYCASTKRRRYSSFRR